MELNYEIDHLFQFVESEDEAYRIANATGLKVFTKTVHAGQGTSGIFLIFEMGYFEFIWLRDANEARSNPLRFDKKAEAIRNGGSPFGVALKAGLTKENECKLGLTNFTRYNPGYGPYTIFISKESMDNLKLPLFFVMAHPERPKNSDWNPYKPGTTKNELCNFDHEIKQFHKVQLFLPEAPSHTFPCVEIIKCDSHRLVIDSGTKGRFSDLVELY